MRRTGAPSVGLTRSRVQPLLQTIGRQQSNSTFPAPAPTPVVSMGDSNGDITKTTRKTAITTTMKKKTMAATAKSGAERDTMDLLSQEDKAFEAGLKKGGVGLGNGLRSERNIAKRGGRSVTPPIMREEGRRRDGGGKERENKASGRVDMKKKGAEAAEAAVTRKSARVTATTTVDDVGTQAKSKKGNKEHVVIDSDSDDNGRRAGKKIKKITISNDNKTPVRPSQSLGVSAQNRRVKVNENGKGNGNSIGTKKILQETFSESDNLSSGSDTDLGFRVDPKHSQVEQNTSRSNTTRSAASTTTGAKGQKSAGKIIAKEPNGNTNVGFTSRRDRLTDTSKKQPMIIDDLECEKEEELYREKLPKTSHRKVYSTYKTKARKRIEVKEHMSGRSAQANKPSPKESINTPSSKPTETLPKVNFINPLLKFNIPIESPDHLSNPQYANRTTNTSSSIEHIDLTQTSSSPIKKRKTTKSNKYLSDSEASALSSLSTSQASSPAIQPTTSFNIDDLDDDLDESSTFLLLETDSKACPICRDPFPATFLANFPSPTKQNNIQTQLDRCRKHKRFSAEEFCREKSYPAMEIKWHDLPRRIKSYIPRLTEILERKRKSTYRDELSSESLVTGGGKGGGGSGRGAGRKRKLMDTNWQSHTPGYYGSKGAHIMLDVVMTKMADRIREVGGTDRVIAVGGVSGFVQSVLVPELGVLLVMEDMHCGEDKAREIVKETVEVGELINEDEDDEGDDGVKDWFLDDDEDGRTRRGEWLTV